MSGALQAVIDNLQSAFASLINASNFDGITPTDDDDMVSAYIAILDLCKDVELQVARVKRTANKHNDILRSLPSVYQMTNFIVNEITRKERTVRKAVSIPGGVESRVLNQADGKCELCGREFRISVHHIIPRAEGGLSEPENYIVLCRECHNEVEDCGYHTREEVLRHAGRTVSINRKTDPGNNGDLSRSEKAAATRAKNEMAQHKEELELAEWDRWAGMFDRAVGYRSLGAPEIPRPEKPWHVYVYGAGRHAKIARE
jgi:5-methylcytosine-specific restriction endonuclease McrA